MGKFITEYFRQSTGVESTGFASIARARLCKYLKPKVMKKPAAARGSMVANHQAICNIHSQTNDVV